MIITSRSLTTTTLAHVRLLALLIPCSCCSPADNDGEEEGAADNSNDDDLHKSVVDHCWGRRGEGILAPPPAFV